MVKHIVMWTFKDYADGRGKDENLKLAAQMLAGLKDKIGTVRFLEVGQNINPSDAAYDLALYSEFDDQAGLDIYQKHPEHLKVVGFLGKVRHQRVVVDYKV